MQGLQKNIHWECSQKDLRMALMPQGWSPLGALGVAVSFWAPQAEGRCANKRWFPLINLSSSEKLCPGEGKKEKAQSWGWRKKDCKEMKWGSCRSSKAEWIQDISMASDSAESWKKWELFPNKTKFLPSSYVSTKMMSDNFQIKKELENKIILHNLRLRESCIAGCSAGWAGGTSQHGPTIPKMTDWLQNNEMIFGLKPDWKHSSGIQEAPPFTTPSPGNPPTASSFTAMSVNSKSCNEASAMATATFLQGMILKD